jgi:hypothetical protein
VEYDVVVMRLLNRYDGWMGSDLAWVVGADDPLHYLSSLALKYTIFYHILAIF